jgi:hypothetical protein
MKWALLPGPRMIPIRCRRVPLLGPRLLDYL